MVKTLSAGSSEPAVGLRRSYGDSNLNPDGRVIDMTGVDRIMSFVCRNGVTRAEAGLSLSQAAGWFLPTTPGTRFVTLGGAVANDLNGNNHHAPARSAHLSRGGSCCGQMALDRRSQLATHFSTRRLAALALPG